MNAFYVVTLLMLVSSVTTLKIDSVLFLHKQVSVRPIRFQQAFHTMWFTVDCQVVERRIGVIAPRL